jgi:hypothetical protein
MTDATARHINDLEDVGISRNIWAPHGAAPRTKHGKGAGTLFSSGPMQRNKPMAGFKQARRRTER